MTRPDVLLMYPMRPIAMAQLQERYTLHRYDEAADKMAFLAEHGAACTAIATNGHAELGAAHLALLPNLRLVSCSSAGFESIDDAALRARGIGLTNTSAALRDDVADCALMLVLACRRRLIAGHAHVASGDWGRTGMLPLTSAIRGKRAGIVGLGSIGQAIADRLAVLGMQIGYTGRNRKPVDYTFHDDARALAEWADVLVVVVPGGPETEGMIDAAVLEALGPTGTLVNVARGSVVDEAALIAALHDGRLGSAGLDVFRNEPNPDPALTSAPNLTLYPHHASGTVETRDAMAQLMVDNLDAHFAGRSLLTPVYALPESA